MPTSTASTTPSYMSPESELALKSSENCPCGAAKPYAQCCAIAHQNPALVSHPEQLMRSRYSAHVLGLVDYVVDTYHPSCQAALYRDDIAASMDSQWVKLDVERHEISEGHQQGFVTFHAYFVQDGQMQCLSERSRFVFEHQRWYYIDGEFIDSPSLSTPTSVPRDTPNARHALTSQSQQAATSHNTAKIGRNDPCFCGSGKKYKKCCG